MPDRAMLEGIYRRLLGAFGRQHWWPGETAFEVMVGAILTQNTNWGNVERAIGNLKGAGLMSPEKLAACPTIRLAELIRPSGYYNIKAQRLREFLHWLMARTDGRGSCGGRAFRAGRTGTVGRTRRSAPTGLPTDALRHELLQVKGIGPETADSILLYALGRPTFVVDAYTRRVLSRHGLISPDAGYETVRRMFMDALPRRATVYNEYHALIVRLGKEFCRPRPRCDACPLCDLLTTKARRSRSAAADNGD